MPAPQGTRPPNAGKSWPRGAANTMTRSLGTPDDAGGQTYLAEQAHQNLTAFLTLLGRVLPREPIEPPPGRDYPGFLVGAAGDDITSTAGR
jgi:hypothetical protein